MLLEFQPEHRIGFGQEVKGYDAGVREIGSEDVLHVKFHEVFDASTFGIHPGLLHQPRVDLQSDSSCSVLLCGRNHDSSVT